jgi:hypothetical protein
MTFSMMTVTRMTLKAITLIIMILSMTTLTRMAFRTVKLIIMTGIKMILNPIIIIGMTLSIMSLRILTINIMTIRTMYKMQHLKDE